jgi:lysophospholipase L1-like esterase
MPDPAVLYIAFGDSTTDGPADQSYPDFLPELLGQPAEAFANEGRGGEETTDGLIRLQEILDGELYPNATTLLYWQGGNDINAFIAEHDPALLLSPNDDDYPFADELAETLDRASANVETIIDTGRASGLSVFVATYFPLYAGLGNCDPLPLDTLFPNQAERANAYITLLNERLRAAAETGGATVVDVDAIGDQLVSDGDNYYNCNHLSETGNELAAEVFADVIGGDMD